MSQHAAGACLGAHRRMIGIVPTFSPSSFSSRRCFDTLLRRFNSFVFMRGILSVIRRLLHRAFGAAVSKTQMSSLGLDTVILSLQFCAFVQNVVHSPHVQPFEFFSPKNILIRKIMGKNISIIIPLNKPNIKLAPISSMSLLISILQFSLVLILQSWSIIRDVILPIEGRTALSRLGRRRGCSRNGRNPISTPIVLIQFVFVPKSAGR